LHARSPEFAQQNGTSADQQFQIIGVLNRLYVLMENANGLVLVDQHAAHERILSRNSGAGWKRRASVAAAPATTDIRPPPRDAEWVERNVATLQKMGIGIEPFGAHTFKIDSVPTFLDASNAAGFMRDVIDELRNASSSSSALRLGEDMIAKTVCRHAVKANDPLRYREVERLISDLLQCDAAVLLPARPADDGSDLQCRAREEVRPEGLRLVIRPANASRSAL
jgi:DNA mismatch repair protein MutL